jgi:hypothetical protein
VASHWLCGRFADRVEALKRSRGIIRRPPPRSKPQADCAKTRRAPP